jgi:hypothetical protein
MKGAAEMDLDAMIYIYTKFHKAGSGIQKLTEDKKTH